MAGELDESWERTVVYRASLDGLDLLEVWRSSVEWVEENGWKITEKRYGEFIRFNHVRETRKSSHVRKAEIHLADAGDGVSLEFRVERRTVFDHEIYLKVIDDYLKHVGVHMNKQELAELYYKGYIIEYAVNLYDVNYPELWGSTVQWINKKKWEVLEIRDNEYIRFNHVIRVGHGGRMREAEIYFSENGGFLSVEFKIGKLGIIDLSRLSYQKVVERYFILMGISLGKEDYSRLFSEKDLNILIRNNFMFIIFVNLFPLYSICRGIYHWTIFALVLVWTSMSVPSILNMIHYKKLKNWLIYE